MERPQHSARTNSELPQPFDPIKQASAATAAHLAVVPHSLPATRTRPSTSRVSSAPLTQRPITTNGTARLSHQRHGHHSSDSSVLQYQYARPITHGTPHGNSHGNSYTHHITSRAEPVPIGNRDIIVDPAEERGSSSPTTAGAASKLLLSMKRTFSIKKAQPVRLLSLKYPARLQLKD